MLKKGVECYIIIFDDIQRYWFVLGNATITKTMPNFTWKTDLNLTVDKSCAFHTMKQATLECQIRNKELLEKYQNLISGYEKKMQKYLQEDNVKRNS